MTTAPRRGRLARAAALLALALPLAACAGYQTDPGVQHYKPSETREDIRTKVGFVQHDECYSRASQHGTERCDRYLTQVRNIALSATDANEHPPEITGPAHVLEQRVQAVFGGNCLPPTDQTAQRCTQLLQSANEALADLGYALATAPPK